MPYECPYVCRYCSQKGHNREQCPLFDRHVTNNLVVNRTKRKRAVDNDGTEPPQKVQYKCSICGNYGHNKRSCRFRKPTSVDAVDNSTNVPAFENNMQTTDASGTNNRTAVLDNGFVVAPVDMQLDDAESAVPCSHTTEILDQLPDKDANVVDKEAPPQHLSTDIVPDATETIPNQQECDCCHRISTDMYPLYFTTSPRAGFFQKEFGDFDATKETLTLCQLCNIFLKKGSPREWRYAWPAFLWSIFKWKRQIPYLVDFIRLVSREIRLSYIQIAENLTECMAYLLDTVEPMVKDYTNVYKKLKTEMSKENIRAPEFPKLLRENAFPDCICCAGCDIYIDYNSKLVQMPHYLATLDTEFSLFDADGGWFSCRNPAWPCAVNICNMYVARAGIVVDDVKGLCFVSCDDKEHAQKNVHYFHVPLAPIHTVTDLKPEPFAAAHLSCNIEMTETESTFNHSFRVARMRGDPVHGVSTFQIKTGPYNHTSLSTEQEIMATVLVDERPDIKHLMDNSWGVGVGKRCQYEALQKTNPIFYERVRENIKLSKLFGNFISDQHVYDFVNITLPNPNTPSPDAERLDGSTNTNRDKNSWLLDRYRFPLLTSAIFGKIMYRAPSKIWSDLTIHGNTTDSFSRTLLELFTNIPNLYLRHLEKQFYFSGRRNQYELRPLIDIIIHDRPVRPSSNRTRMLLGFENYINASNIPNTNFDTPVQKLLHWISVESNNCSVIYDVGPILDNPPQNLFKPDDTHLLVVNNPNFYTSPLWQHLIDCGWSPLFLSSLSGHFIGRWGNEFCWQKSEMCEDRFSFDLARFPDALRDFDFFVFERPSTVATNLKARINEMCLGQNVTECAFHKMLLVTNTKDVELPCCVTNCANVCKFRCPFSKNPSCMCKVGVCKDHFEKYKIQSTKSLERLIRIPVDPIVEQRLLQDVAVKIYDKNRKDVERLLKTLDSTNTNADNVERLIARKIQKGNCFVESSKSMGSHYMTSVFMRMRPQSILARNPPLNVQHCLQQINSSTSDNCNLLFPEPKLFPSTFWSSAGESFFGAIPFSLYSAADKCFGDIASVNQHCIIRTKNFASLTSQSPDYRSWCFDIMMNSKSKMFPIKMVMKRGPEIFSNSKYADGVGVSLVQGLYSTDNGRDNRRGVGEIAAMARVYGPWRYFYTLTCNDKQTPSIAEIYERIREVHGKDPSSYKRACISMLPLIMLAWNRFVHYMLRFIEFGPQRPLGPVVGVVARREFQDDGALGNKPHVHIGITVHPSENMKVSLNRIRCLPHYFFCQDIRTDYESLLKDGWVNSHSEYDHIYATYTRLNRHECKGKGRTNRIHFANENRKDIECRVAHMMTSLDYGFRKKYNLYTDEQLKAFFTVGLSEYVDNFVAGTCHNCSDGCNYCLQPVDKLCGGRCTYIAHAKEQFSPHVPILFLCSLSTGNVQICDFRFQMGYLFKYSLGKEHHREVEISKHKRDINSHVVGTSTVPQYNSKSGGVSDLVIGSKANEWQREISDTETTFVLLNCIYISASVKFVHAMTLAPEDRSAMLKYNRKSGDTDFANGTPKGVQQYHHLTDPRHKFTANQIVMINDWFASNCSSDRIMSFNLRPPLLRVFDSLEFYCKFFAVRQCAQKRCISQNPATSPFVDGANHIVKLRLSHLDEAVEFLQTVAKEKFQRPESFSAQWLLDNIFLNLQLVAAETRPSAVAKKWFAMFVDIHETKKCVVVFPSVRVDDTVNFLYHLLLTNGRFVCELDLAYPSDWRFSFHLAHILPEPPDEASVHKLAVKYIQNDLMFQPISTGCFGRSVMQLTETLKSFFLNKQTTRVGQPLLLYRAIRQAFSEKVSESLNTHQRGLAETLVKHLTVTSSDVDITTNLPSPDDIVDCKSRHWQPQIPKTRNQTAASFAEQESAFGVVRQSIDNYLTANSSYHDGVFLTGPPGSGKTYVAAMGIVYAMSRGLKTMVTSLTSFRARDLGGVHLHCFFGLRDMDFINSTSTTIAENTLLFLERYPERRDLIRAIDVLLIEEAGMISSQQLSAVDKILRGVRNNPFVPFGGVLVICTGDPQQLQPIKGRPVWLSIHIYTSFKIIVLREFVRSAGDMRLQNFLKAMSRYKLTDTEIRETVQLLSDGLSDANFVTSIAQVPAHFDFVFATKKAVTTAAQELARNDTRHNDTTCFVSSAEDIVEKSPGKWVAASPSDTSQINKQMREIKDLRIIEKSLMRFTYNGKTNKGVPFSQGQICIVDEIRDTDTDKPKVFVALVPTDITHPDVNNIPLNWPRFKVAARLTDSIFISKNTHFVRAKRKQFPLVVSGVTTIHKAMGRTCKNLCTKLSVGDSNYKLWDKSLLYVLISRVETFHNILFVGSRHQTLAAVSRVLRLESRTMAYVQKMLEHLDISQHRDNVAQTGYFYHVTKIEIPPFTPCVYLICSSQQPDACYVGQSKDFRRRLGEHNSLEGGSASTNFEHLKPWVPAAIVTGFTGDRLLPENKKIREAIEEEWHFLLSIRASSNLAEAIDIGIRALDRAKFKNQQDTRFQHLKLQSFFDCDLSLND